jgi:two-component system response regulator HydG
LPSLGRFAEEIQRVAASDVTLLIEGESGAGKNVCARAVHAASPRSGGAYLEVQLSALAPSLIDAELFGHEAGAFTGADRARTGRFLRAQNGSIVLDGIECLSLQLQVKLLRVLQERVVEPLGSEQSFALDVRVIALSNRDLEAEVRAGRFREDLYYRLAVVKLSVPPLRERLDDLDELCAHFLGRAARRLGVEPRALSAGALDRLRAHAWPGNLRELENALERVSVLAPRSTGDARAAGDRRSAGERSAAHGAPPVEPSELEFLAEAARGMAEDLARQALAHGVGLEELERALLVQALGEQRGNMSAAARRLRLSRRAFEHRYERAIEAQRASDEQAGEVRRANDDGASDRERALDERANET